MKLREIENAEVIVHLNDTLYKLKGAYVDNFSFTVSDNSYHELGSSNIQLIPPNIVRASFSLVCESYTEELFEKISKTRKGYFEILMED